MMYGMAVLSFTVLFSVKVELSSCHLIFMCEAVLSFYVRQVFIFLHLIGLLEDLCSFCQFVYDDCHVRLY